MRKIKNNSHVHRPRCTKESSPSIKPNKPKKFPFVNRENHRFTPVKKKQSEVERGRENG